MKKLIAFVLLLLSCSYFYGREDQTESCFMGSLSSGFVFKRGCDFKEVYHHGLINVITADGCYYPWELWGIGAKVSYWRRHGKTSFLRQCTLAQEVPLTFYLRRRTIFDSGTNVYASLGGGVIWAKEKSYLGCARLVKGIAEAEVGFQYPIGRCFNLVGAVRYLFPRQCQSSEKVDIGGLDLRAGIGFEF